MNLQHGLVHNKCCFPSNEIKADLAYRSLTRLLFRGDFSYLLALIFKIGFLLIIGISNAKANYLLWSSTQKDSLETQLGQQSDHSQRLGILLQLSELVMYDSTELALEYAKQAHELFWTVGTEEQRTGSLLQLAQLYEIAGHLDSAITYYESAFKLNADQGKYKEACDVLMQMAITCYYEEKWAKSIGIYEEVYKIATRESLVEVSLRAARNAGAIFQELGRYQEAIKMYRLATPLVHEVSDSLNWAQNAEELGMLYSLGTNLDSAEFFLSAAANMYRALEIPEDRIFIELTLAKVWIEQSKTTEAEMMLERLLKTDAAKLHLVYAARVNLMLAQIRTMQQRYDEALTFLDVGYEAIAPTDEDDAKAEFMRLYAEVFQNRHQFEQALDYTKRRLSLMDTLNQRSKMDLQHEMKAQFRMHQEEAKIQAETMQQLQQARERQWLWALLSISLLFLLVVSIFAHNKVRSNRVLKEKNRIIDQSLREKEVLIKEIQHRVKNNLQVISSMLSLQAKSVQNQEVLHAIKQGKDRIFSLALLHQNYQFGEEGMEVDLKHYVEALSRSIVRTHSQQKQISLHTEVQSLLLDVDVLVPVGLILNELLSNIIHYSLGDTEEGRIEITLQVDEEGLNLVLRDNGKPLSTSQMEQLNRSGFALIQAYLRKLHGTLDVTSENGTQVLSCTIRKFRKAA